LHVTPTYSSWINQVERWFAALTDKPIRRGSHRSTRALEDAIRLCLATYDAEPRPFVWVKTADDILASIARFALRTSETGHWVVRTGAPGGGRRPRGPGAPVRPASGERGGPARAGWGRRQRLSFQVPGAGAGHEDVHEAPRWVVRGVEEDELVRPRPPAP